MNKPESILVTGGAGFIGTHLSRRLAAAGNKVRVIDLKKPEKPIAGVEYIQGDVRNLELLNKALEGATTVYHLAATVSVPLCQHDPVDSYSNNFQATLGILEAIRQRADKGAPRARFIFASTAALYGSKGDDGRALAEHDIAKDFLSYYAAQKHASEQAIQLYCQFHKIPAFVFRFFNVFGPGQDPTSPYSGVITIFARLAREKKPLGLNGGGTQTRDFISVHDLVDGLTAPLALPTAKWDAQPTNLGTGTKITIRQLAETLLKACNGTSEITVAPPREGDVLHSLADISRARQVIDFKPKVDLASGLKELLGTP